MLYSSQLQLRTRAMLIKFDASLLRLGDANGVLPFNRQRQINFLRENFRQLDRLGR